MAKVTKPIHFFKLVSFESLLKGGWYFPIGNESKFLRMMSYDKSN